MDVDEDIKRVLGAHATQQAPARPLSRERLVRLLALLGRPTRTPSIDDEGFELLSLLGLDDEAEHELTRIIQRMGELGVEVSDAIPVLQAFSRGVARIVEAEATVISEQLRDVPQQERARYLDRMLEGLPLTVRIFEVLQTSLLQATLLDELTPSQLDREALEQSCIALVDLCGSTRYLAQADEGQARELVDALFEAGQASALTRPVRVLKYVGDGIFLVGRDAAEVVGASFAAIERIDSTLPLDVRAGVAWGPLVRRAGDYFGLAVNMAQLLTKVARPGEVLASEEAARQLPEGLIGRSRRVRITGWDDRLSVRSIRRPPA